MSSPLYLALFYNLFVFFIALQHILTCYSETALYVLPVISRYASSQSALAALFDHSIVYRFKCTYYELSGYAGFKQVNLRETKEETTIHFG